MSLLDRLRPLSCCFAMVVACEANEPDPRDPARDGAEPSTIVEECTEGYALDCAVVRRHASLLASPRNVRREWKDGAAEWTDLLIDRADHGRLRDLRLRCDREPGPGADLTQTCYYALTLLLEGAGEERARTVAAQVSLLGRPNEDACANYAACRARMEVGATLPFPDDETTPVALLLVTQAIPASKHPELEDPELIDRSIRNSEHNITQFESTVEPGDYRGRYTVMTTRQSIEYRKIVLKELRQR